ncbi:hypothetical protein UlMin_026064 [Ulmus minor]
MIFLKYDRFIYTIYNSLFSPPSMGLVIESDTTNETTENQYHKGVRKLCERGITNVPEKYILPEAERPCLGNVLENSSLKLPVIDFSQLLGPNRSNALSSLAKACQEYGVFQLINHGIEGDVIGRMIDVSKRFFDLPFEERSKYMSKDIHSPVRCGTSFNQNNDQVFCWRDFLKLTCHPLSEVLPFWPSSPADLREAVVNFSKNTKFLYLMLMEAILESLGLLENNRDDDKEKDGYSKEFEDGSQLVVVNCYPPCPEPELTLGLPPHSDYGLLTLLLQDEVEGLQIHHQGKWVTVEPIPCSFVVNVGDHLEILSNGRYKSVLHRVFVNSSKSRISIASLHSLAFNTTVKPSPKLVDKANPKLYKDTDLSTFLHHIASSQHKNKNFLESRKFTSS